MENVDYKTGEVRQIMSGNGIMLAGPVDPETGVPRTKYVTLSGISCPDFSTQDKETPRQQPYGFRAREYLRNLVLGKKVEFAIEHKIKDSSDKVIGHIKINNEDVSIELLRRGLGQLRGGSKSINLDKYEEAQNYAKSKKLGLWDTSKQDLLVIKPIGSTKDISEKFLGKRFTGNIVEDVQGVFVFFLYVPELEGLLKCSFGDIYAPSVNQNFTKKVKYTLDGMIVQQNVDFVVLGYDEKMQAVRVDLFKGQTDVKRELLAMGYFKLAQNAYSLVLNQQRFNELRDAQTQAELNGVGIWKDAQKKPSNNSIIQGGTTFDGRVIEIHSGDSTTVYNEKTKENVRIFLASIRAPQFTAKDQKPWGYEAKEFLRRHAVGKQVVVEVEYEKKIPAKVGGDDDDRKSVEMQMTFGNIIIQDKEEKVPNLSLQIISAGLAQVQPPRGEDGFSRHLEEYKLAQETATKSKKGLHGKENQNLPKFNDYSQQGQSSKAKQAFSFLKDEKKLTGIVDLVLNGSRFKVRFDQSACYGIFILAGIKCLPNDPNFPEHQKFSNLGLQFSKQNVLQRDVEIELESVDKKGIFHGHLFVNKQNYALRLLENGYAVTFNPMNSNKFAQNYEDAEQKASQRKEGLWSLKNLNLASIRGENEEYQSETMKSLNSEIRKLIVTEIIDSNQLYLQDPNSKVLSKIEEALESFVPTEQNKLVAPLKKGLICVAKYSADKKWYRAKINRDLTQKGKDGRYEVFFVDYGNFANAPISDIRRIPDSISQLPNQAIKSALSSSRGPSFNHPYSNQVAGFIREQVWDKDLIVQLDNTDGNTTYVTIFLTKEKTLDRTLNYLLLSKGQAKLDKFQPQCPHKSWVDSAEIAQNENLGIWNYDDEEEDQ